MRTYAAVTIRERDSCSQVRVPVSEAVELVVKFITRGLTWSAAQARYAGQKSSAAGGEGAATPVQVCVYVCMYVCKYSCMYA
jgi:hypothetical protein